MLHSFNGSDGRVPPSLASSSMPAEDLYSTTAYGSNLGTMPLTLNCNVVFKLAPNSDGSWTESIFASSPTFATEPPLLAASSSMRLEISMARPRVEAVKIPARFSSCRQMPIEAGRRACCTSSSTATEETPMPA